MAPRLAAAHPAKVGRRQIWRHNHMALSAPYAFAFPVDQG